MTSYTFFTHPMSRGQIARWALHEVSAEYQQVLVDWQNKPAALTAANLMGKVPTIIHHSETGDRVVTEGAAICAYLAEVNPEASLLPSDAEAADYYRWMFFAAGPMEQAIVGQSMGWEVPKERQGMVGFGSLERVLTTVKAHLGGRDYVCGPRFTMADVYLGSQIDWGLIFGSVPPEPEFVAYTERLQLRAAYKAAKSIDNALIEASRK